MIFHRLGLINKKERGFTLIELLVALAITGLITGAITTTIFQVVNVNARTNNHMTAVRQVQNAGYWVSHDGQMAQIVELAEPPQPPKEHPVGTPFPLKLTWTEWDGTVNEVTYTLEPAQTQALVRQNLTYAADGSPMGDETTIVARYINPGLAHHTNLKFVDGVLIFTVTAKVGTGSQEQSETRTYEIIPRPSI